MMYDLLLGTFKLFASKLAEATLQLACLAVTVLLLSGSLPI